MQQFNYVSLQLIIWDEQADKIHAHVGIGLVLGALTDLIFQ